ncbi:DUF4401 domain-containing protein [Muricauda sp. CAU 1633]|uniref:DUF4401 domain-containing protein n=1 Tax=Allomuricauda sp. CAU 1633 TaxID=2816036 RepID=UPI001A8FA332|nr:DUF4401 domain-containing protein [Muricauda sp. CAU 1633]MBO0321028.1 DUF4401 domain-containing protein [Muricauda sp. CAU 1633]
MGKLEDIQQHLKNIKSLEGNSFEYDEKAILQEYEKRGGEKSSFIIKALSIFGGFLASIAFLGFLLILGLYNSETTLLLVGVGLIIASIVLVKKYDKLIIDTFGISLYILGLILFIFGLSNLEIHEDVVTLLVMGIAFFSLFLVQNPILSFFSILILSGGLLTLIISNDAYSLIHLYINLHAFALTYMFLNESSMLTSELKLIKLYDPLRIALVFSLLFGLAATAKHEFFIMSQAYFWMSSLVIILILLYVVNLLLKTFEVDSPKTKLWVYLLSGLTLLPTLFAPAISGALLIVLLSFKVNYKTSLTIGIIALVFFVILYYYDLNFTLLTKSIILFSSGLVFLFFYVFLTKKLKSNEKV